MLSQFIQDEIIDWIRGNSFPAAPTTVYLSLHTGDPGANGANEHGGTAAYERTAVTFDASGDVAADVEFPEASADYSADITHLGLHTDQTAGDFVIGGPATNGPVTITEGQIPRVSAGAVSVLLNAE